MEYIILLLLFLLILLMQVWIMNVEKKQNKLRERIYEIELNRSVELLKAKKEEKPKAEVKLTKEKKEKQERMKTAFDNLMNYDETIARKIRK